MSTFCNLLLALFLFWPISARANSESFSHWNNAWNAALALTNDAADRAKLQQELIASGRRAGAPLDAVEARAREIDGWRRWAALADLGAEYARAGDRESARRLGLEALYKAPLFKEDEHDRVLKRALWALAGAGETNITRDYVLRYQNSLMMREHAEAADALARARAGDAEDARRLLEELNAHRADDGAVLRTRAFEFWSDLEGGEGLLIAAWHQSEAIPGYRRTDERLRLLDDAHGRISDELERAWIATLAEDIDQLPAPIYVRALQCAALARALARVGEAEQARARAEQARAWSMEIELIERPEIWASAARALHRAGFQAEAGAWFHDALDAARALTNLRPRCIALARVHLALAMTAAD